mmetsp:Transcript_24157/g.35128  ORF Transcript_24157/g.35128 Transcript_24157/m.35128 type:complete len:295 (+) Transcript_24157:854-1738(+)
MKRNAWSSRSTRQSTVSLVVPAMSLTIARSSPMILFSRLDFPTLGRPTMATFRISSSPTSFGSTTGMSAQATSSTSAIPLPWMPLTGRGSPRPRPQKSEGCIRPCVTDSHLLTARATGVFCRRRKAAISSSRVVQPAGPSTTMTAAEASSRAISACWRISLMKTSSGSSSKTRPPVSTTSKFHLFQKARLYVRSRVTPGSSNTIDPSRCLWAILLTMVLFPTFGLPTTASTGIFVAFPFFFVGVSSSSPSHGSTPAISSSPSIKKSFMYGNMEGSNPVSSDSKFSSLGSIITPS